MGLDSHERLRRAERLQRLGLAPAPAKAYLALLELGETEARDVARLSGIPFAKVYAALEDLHARGLANVLLDTPRRYSPKPIDEYVASIRAAREEELRALEREQADLATLLRIEPDATADDRGLFTMVRGRRGSIKKITNLVTRAQKDLVVLASESFPGPGEFGGALLQDAIARGVRTRILAQASRPEHGAIARRLPAAQVRYAAPPRGAQNVAMVIVDASTALVTQFVPDDADLRQGHDVGMVTSQRAIVLSLLRLLETTWEASTALFPQKESADARRNDSV